MDANGLVTAVGAGTASITATSTANTNEKASVTITVTAPAVRNVTVSPQNAIMKPGDSQAFVANVDADPGVARTVTWTSSSNAVATVDAAGVVTAVAPGAATITATSTANPSVSGAAAITVRQPIPATVSVQNITLTGTAGQTANLNNIAGSIDVNLNVDPGEQVVNSVDVLIDGNVACSQNLSGAQSEALRIAAAFENVEEVIVSCQINTAAFDSTTGVADFFNGQHTLSARANLEGGSQIATPSTQLTFNNISGVIATVAFDNGSDPAAAIRPQTGLQWVSGNATLRIVGVSYVQGTTVASVNCSVFGKNARNFTLTNGTNTTSYDEDPWSATDLDLGDYLTDLVLTPAGETIVCPSAVLSNGQPMPVPTGSTLLNFGPFPGQQANAAMPALQVIRYDGAEPGLTPTANGVVQAPITLGAITSPWVTSTTSLQPSTSSVNVIGLPSLNTLNALTAGADIDEGVDAITVTVNVPAAGSALPGTAAACDLTGLTAVTTGADLAETTVSTAYPMRIVFSDALGNRTCLDQTPIGADFVAPSIVSVTGPADSSFFTSQAAITDFSFNVTDNASGFGPNPVNVKIVRLDSANTAFCVLGTGSSCTATNVPLTFDPTNLLTNNGYYTITYAVRDQAGNLTGTTTITYLLDAVAPTWAGGVSLPSVIAGATTNTFTATPSDNLDLDDVYGVVDYPTIDIRYPSQSLGSFGPPLEMGGTSIGYSVANWLRCINPAGDFASTGNQPTLINMTATDQAGNTGTLASPAFGANAQACGPVAGGAAGFNSFNAVAVSYGTGKTEVDRDGANLATTSVTSATLTVVADVPLNTTADPFARVEFYYEVSPGVLRLVGTATGVLAQTPTTRTYTYTFVWDPDATIPTGTINVVAIGVDAEGDAVMSNALGGASIVIVP